MSIFFLYHPAPTSKGKWRAPKLKLSTDFLLMGERLGCSWSVIKQKAKPFFRKILSSFQHKKNQTRLFTRSNPFVALKMVHFAPKRNVRYVHVWVSLPYHTEFFYPFPPSLCGQSAFGRSLKSWPNFLWSIDFQLSLAIGLRYYPATRLHLSLSYLRFRSSKASDLAIGIRYYPATRLHLLLSYSILFFKSKWFNIFFTAIDDAPSLTR